MADWTNIPNGNIETGKPIRAIDGRALRDNPIAIAEGAVGAPRIADAALGSTVTSAGETWVAARMIARTHGGIGTLALARHTGSGVQAMGTQIAGSALVPGQAAGAGSGSLSGTWRLLGYLTTDTGQAARTTLWQRVS